MCSSPAFPRIYSVDSHDYTVSMGTMQTPGLLYFFTTLSQSSEKTSDKAWRSWVTDLHKPEVSSSATLLDVETTAKLDFSPLTASTWRSNSKTRENRASLSSCNGGTSNVHVKSAFSLSTLFWRHSTEWCNGKQSLCWRRGLRRPLGTDNRSSTRSWTTMHIDLHHLLRKLPPGGASPKI